jgi:hypothetical protein
MEVLHKQLAVAQLVVRFKVLQAHRAVIHKFHPSCLFWDRLNHLILMLVHMQHQQSSTRTPLGKAWYHSRTKKMLSAVRSLLSLSTYEMQHSEGCLKDVLGKSFGPLNSSIVTTASKDEVPSVRSTSCQKISMIASSHEFMQRTC